MRDYAGSLEKAATMQGNLRAPTLREQVTNDLQYARANVARLEELGKLIDANPDVGRILELLGNH